MITVLSRNALALSCLLKLSELHVTLNLYYYKFFSQLFILIILL